MKTLNKYAYKVFTFISILLSYLWTMPAFADIGEITQAATRADDKSRQALITVFGDVVQDPLSGAGSGGTILSSLFGVANGAILVVGGIAAIYFFFKKVTQTAHDGSVYSQNQHTVWGPLRLLFGVAALAPTANGWSLSQLMMLWAASVMGVGSANLATDAAVTALSSGQGMVIQPAMSSTTDLAKSLYQVDLCMHGINAGLTQAANSGALTPENSFIQQTSTARGFVLKNQSFTCGGANLNASAAAPATTSTGALFVAIDAVSIYQAHQQALQQMQTTISANALGFVNAVVQKQNGAGGSLPDSSAQIKSAALAYENTVQASISAKQSEIQALASKVSDNVKTNGWWILGSWYQTFAQANTRLSDAVQGKASTFGASGGDPGSTNVFQAAMNAFDTQQTLSAASTTNALGSDPENPPTNSTSSQIIGSIFSAPGQRFVNWIVNTSNTGQVNPLIQMKNLGDYVLGTAEIALGTYTVLGVADEVKKGDSAVGLAAGAVNFFTSIGDAASGAFGALKPFIIAAIFSLFMIGATLSVYLPFIPFMVWFGAIINWLVVVGEAIIAAPLWALTPLAGEGEGMGHRSAHGWIFLLNVMVRPILMVIGFFLGGAALVAAGTVLNAMFGTAIANVQYDSTTGLITIITLLVLYCSMCINLVHTCFNLILIVPDQVINWVGGHASANIGRDDSIKTGHAIEGFNRKLENLMPKPTTRVGGGNSSSDSNRGNGASN